MVTYNKADGTGGLDASIRFEDEHARPEVKTQSNHAMQSILILCHAEHRREL
jgi:hypothetical protein